MDFFAAMRDRPLWYNNLIALRNVVGRGRSISARREVKRQERAGDERLIELRVSHCCISARNERYNTRCKVIRTERSMILEVNFIFMSENWRITMKKICD